MRILFCDDDTAFLHTLINLTKRELHKLEVEGELLPCSSGKELLQQVDQTPADALFLDIDMPEMSGFDIAGVMKRMPDSPIIVFVSSLDHLVFESFAYHPFWFLRKSDLEPLAEMVRKLADHVRLRKHAYVFEANGQNVSVLLKDILYVESDNHYVTVYTVSESYRYKARIGEIAKALSAFHFVRAHVGFVVNCQHIALIRQNDLLLRSGECVPVSRNRAKHVQQQFMAYTRSVQV